MQTSPDDVVLNHETTTDFEAEIDVGQVKLKFFISIHNWWVSYPMETIYIALTNITASFRFPRISANVTGAFGFIAEFLYFISTSYVFGLNTSASSWEAFRRAIQNLIPVLSQRNDLTQKHSELINMVKWQDEKETNICQAHPCDINQGVLDVSGKVKLLEANIYIDDILAAAALKENIMRLLAATIEAIFLVC